MESRDSSDEARKKELFEAVAAILSQVPARTLAIFPSRWIAAEKRKTDPHSVY